MNYNIIAYSIYLPVTIALSVWIAKSLHKNTKAFLLEKFHTKEELANSTNNLIQTGFYLIALGYSFMHMRIPAKESWNNGVLQLTAMSGSQETIETLASKVGSFTLMLGVLLFLNFFLMFMIQTPKKPHATET